MTGTQAMIVVGVEGTARSEAGDTAAIELGAWEAARRQAGLHLVHGHQAAPEWLQDRTTADDGAPARTRTMLHRIVDRTTIAHPGIVVTGAVDDGGLAGAITAASCGTGLAIVPADSRVRYGGLLAGLVSIQVVTHARTSAIVVAPPVPRRAPAVGARIVVGVDGSPGSADAVAFAFEEAQARGARLDAIYVWEPSVPDRGTDLGPFHAVAGRMLRAATAPWEDTYPDVVVGQAVVCGDNPVRALNDAADGADLIVVGRRGNGGFDDLLLGSVSDGLVRYSRRTVVVVRSADAG
ncbi:universal stress protein [Dactylosporangium sp. NPDC049525]|uniref:universal stress protein n=1 Tax=Dactylosporangium sp. NPDC049525 TaxID=3154730 RepID=UPI00342E8F55